MSISEITALAAREIRCEPGAAWAVAYVESSLGKHLFRFEPHLFRRETGRKARTFKAAEKIDPEAAARACSIGVFQVLGKWHVHLGYATAREMMAALMVAADVDGQADSIVKYCRDVAPAAGSALRSSDPRAFALAYNGPAAVERGYHLKIKAALEMAGGSAAVVLREGASGESVRYLQKLLDIKSDGWFGAETTKAVKAFQTEAGLTVDGVVGRRTWIALKAQESDFTRDVMDVAERAEAAVRGAGKRALGLLGSAAAAAGWLGFDGLATVLSEMAQGDFGAAGSLALTAGPWLIPAVFTALAALFFFFAIRSFNHDRAIRQTLPNPHSGDAESPRVIVLGDGNRTGGRSGDDLFEKPALSGPDWRSLALARLGDGGG